MRRTWFVIQVLLIAAVSAAPTLAQESASYKIAEHAFNAGGDPSGGAFASSASYKIRLDAVGELAAPALPASASFRVSSGLVSFYPPPGEVLGLGFATKTALTWNPERSVGTYGLYRGSVSDPGGDGDCLQPQIHDASTTDGDVPAAGESYFYLVTAKNLLLEEGTKGFRSSGSERQNSVPCP